MQRHNHRREPTHAWAVQRPHLPLVRLQDGKQVSGPMQAQGELGIRGAGVLTGGRMQWRGGGTARDMGYGGGNEHHALERDSKVSAHGPPRQCPCSGGADIRRIDLERRMGIAAGLLVTRP